MQNEATGALTQFGAQSGIATLISEYAWLFVVGFLLLLFKSSIENSVAGLQVFFGSDYDEDDVVIVDGRPGRITRVGLTKTVFYLYTYRSGVLVGGTKIAVPNTTLKHMRIEKPLEKLEAEDYWKWSEGPNGRNEK
mgnify:FL=1|tara:strand:+ start:1384 stop:1791 length:408 start_codon:yes stop_codon:yes gene_type:complete